MNNIITKIKAIDWLMVRVALTISLFGMFTMKNFGGNDGFFTKQLMWLGISFGIFLIVSITDFRFLKRSGFLVSIYLFFIFLLLALFITGQVTNGAQSWFDLGGFSFQPVDMMKLVVVLMLAKYFSRRHVEIAHIKHLFISAVYAIIPFILVFLQPDFGSAIIIFFIWVGMVMVSGLSRKHLLIIMSVGLVAFISLWLFVFQDYQKARILNFVNPYADIKKTGYNAYQSMVAVGSGQITGKGIGYGTQSKLLFLPEYQTDFIFAAYAEEWGFIGSIILLLLFSILLWRIILYSSRGESNFEMLFGIGVAILFMSHIIINIGMNIGIMPVTGITLPFMSYGGSHLMMEFICLGLIMSMKRSAHATHRDNMKNEFLGI